MAGALGIGRSMRLKRGEWVLPPCYRRELQAHGEHLGRAIYHSTSAFPSRLSADISPHRGKRE